MRGCEHEGAQQDISGHGADAGVTERESRGYRYPAKTDKRHGRKPTGFAGAECRGADIQQAEADNEQQKGDEKERRVVIFNDASEEGNPEQDERKRERPAQQMRFAASDDPHHEQRQSERRARKADGDEDGQLIEKHNG